MTRDEVLAILKAHYPELAALGVTSLALFGSFARDEAGPGSDVDLLVDFDAPPTFGRYMDLKFLLEDLLGRGVDLVPREGLKPRLRPIVEREDSVSRDFRLYLDDILVSARKALAYTQGLTQDQFLANNLVRDAVLLNLQIIGEAASHVPDEVRARHPEVEWRRIIGLRNVIAHGYFTLNQETIWDIVRSHLPVLPDQIERILAEWPEP